MIKFLHTADWHLGKRLGEHRLLTEQQALLTWLLATAVRENVQGILLSGDIYDRSIPHTEAVTLFDSFLTKLAEAGIPLFAVSGNHDSAERISFASDLLGANHIHFSPVFDGTVRQVRVAQGEECAYVHLLPFLRPVHVTAAYGLSGELSYSEAMAEVLDRMTMPSDGVHILVAHQFFTGGIRSESEEIPLVGTLDAVESALLDRFDYAALGHLHRHQHTGKTAQYAGTLMPYAFSETDTKGCVLVEIENGTVSTRFLPVPEGLTHTLVTLTGSYDTLLSKDFRDSCPHTEDYLRLVLTEDTPVPDAMARLGVVYPRIVQLTYQNLVNRTAAHLTPLSEDPLSKSIEEILSPEGVFAAFYARQNEEPLSPADCDYIRSLLADWERGDNP